MQMMGLCGPSIIFAGDPGLVTHITNESASSAPKYLRVNPLDSWILDILHAGPLVIWCQLYQTLLLVVWWYPVHIRD